MTQSQLPTGLTSQEAPAQHAPLGAIAASGFAWNLVVSILSKIVGAVSQIALARLLIPEEFGAYTLATIVIAFATLPRDSALPQVLVHRQQHFERWANPAFWMSLALGVLSGAVMAIAGLVFYLRGGHTVAGLLWITAVGSPLIATSIVPVAALQAQLRFKLIAQISAISMFLTAALSVLMAAMHFGAYSLIVPLVGVAVVRSIYYFFIVRFPLRADPEWIKWRAMAIDGGFLIVAALGGVVVGQGDYITLSWRYDKYVLGIYFFAFNLAVQAIVLLSGSLVQVLFPTLARLNDEKPRQISAYLRVSRTLAAVGMPLCTLQILLGRPAVIAIFGAKWSEAVPLVQILSVGIAFAMVNGFFVTMLQAQGRFQLMAMWTIITIAVFFSGVQIGVRVDGLIGVAIAVSAYHLVFGSIGMRLALSRWAGWKEIARVFVPPILACTIAGAPVISMCFFWPLVYAGNAPVWLTIIVLGVYSMIFLAIFVAGLRLLAREVYAEIVLNLYEKVLRRRRLVRI